MIYEKNSSWQIRHSSMYSSVISRNAGIDHMTIKVISGFDLIIRNLGFNFSYVISSEIILISLV